VLPMSPVNLLPMFPVHTSCPPVAAPFMLG
jgi:hypothetical protein